MIKTIACFAFYYQLFSSVKERDWMRTVDWLIIIGGLKKSGVLVEQMVKVRADN